MEVFGKSDIGLTRQLNEDSFYYGWNDHGDFLAMICDGIGGSAAGEVASKLAVEIVREQFEKAGEFKKDYEVDEWIRLALNKANDAIFSKSMWSKKNRGMGTTAVGVIICSIGTYIFNVGDSRIYALYEDGLIQMSEDHSVIQTLLNQKKITEQQARTHEKRNTLTNALGVWRIFKIDVNKIKSDYSMLLLSSDGLHGYIPDETIEKVIEAKGSVKEKVCAFIDMANRTGGHDNCTVILISKERQHAR